MRVVEELSLYIYMYVFFFFKWIENRGGGKEGEGGEELDGVRGGEEDIGGISRVHVE